MRYAVNIPPFTDPRTVVKLARDAESAGWDAVFLWDHLLWSTKIKPDVHDPWVLLGAIAQATERVRLGTLVTPLSRRRVHIVAKHLLTLDHLSAGRVTFGVGLGEPAVADFSAFGDEPDAKTRAAMLDEGLAVLDQFLRGVECPRGEAASPHGSMPRPERPGSSSPAGRSTTGSASSARVSAVDRPTSATGSPASRSRRAHRPR